MAEMFVILADYFMKMANKCARLADISLWRNLNNSDGGYICDIGGLFYENGE
ncbi:hypothetical protein [Ureibacillus sp. FSL W7-1570]|uniref:hypothetical protein n=1 Tax=Ureibacillus sp. FSL W7-1570 TaxID=2954593 RepID=UPI00315A990B